MEEFLDKYHVGENLSFLSRVPDKSIDLVYMDPPFYTQKKRTYTSIDYEYDDKFESLEVYLDYIRKIVKENRRILKRTGSIYFHIGVKALPYVTVILDEVFGINNRISIIHVRRCGTRNDGKFFSNCYDSIVFCCVSRSQVKFKKTYLELTEEEKRRRFTKSDEVGRFHPSRLVASAHLGGTYEYDVNGIRRKWLCPEYTMDRLRNEGMIYYANSGVPYKKVYLENHPGKNLTDLWEPYKVQNVKYPTQKSIKLLRRIVWSSTDEGDIVLDPFAGSGSTLIAAKELGRRYIGIDKNEDGKKVFEVLLNTPA